MFKPLEPIGTSYGQEVIEGLYISNSWYRFILRRYKMSSIDDNKLSYMEDNKIVFCMRCSVALKNEEDIFNTTKKGKKYIACGECFMVVF